MALDWVRGNKNPPQCRWFWCLDKTSHSWRSFDVFQVYRQEAEPNHRDSPFLWVDPVSGHFDSESVWPSPPRDPGGQDGSDPGGGLLADGHGRLGRRLHGGGREFLLGQPSRGLLVAAGEGDDRLGVLHCQGSTAPAL